jgi:ABC-2 type transport system permease protein/lipopolysaccharide transport system permease protein
MVCSVSGSAFITEELPERPGRTALAWRDLADGARKSWMWTALAFQDIKLRYRGSLLGPWWLTITTSVMAMAISLFYAQIFSTSAGTYLPYVTIGLVVWQLISGLITEACETFLRAQTIIEQVPLPFSIHAYRGVCRQLIIFAHNIAIVPAVLIATRTAVDWRMIEAVSAVAVLAVNGLWVSILLGMLSARFRDIPPIIGSLLQVGFLLTPVFWPIAALGDWVPMAAFNPIFAAIDVVRAPLLGIPTGANSWIVLLGSTILGWLITYALFARFRMRIAYWI